MKCRTTNTRYKFEILRYQRRYRFPSENSWVQCVYREVNAHVTSPRLRYISRCFIYECDKLYYS